MPDPLNALRRLYGEPGPEGIPAAGDEAEARALAEVKAGLDALPKRRPTAATLDAVSAAAAAPVPLPDDDPAEAAALADVEAGLAALPRRRPDAATLEAVFAAAAPAAAAPAPAADRPARRSASRRRAAALGTSFVLLLAVASVLWLVPGDVAVPPIAANAPQEETASAEPDNAPVEEEAEQAEPSVEAPVAGDIAPSVAAPSADARLARAASALAAETEAEAGLVLTGDLPLADGDDELRLLYLRLIEMQAAQAGLGWDEPPAALGAAPDSAPASSGWMQVRVER